MKPFIFMVCGIGMAFGGYGQVVVDHGCTDLGSIPSSAIAQAKATLRIAYGHTSHGSQLISGMSGLIGQSNLIGYQGDIYQWNDTGEGGALLLHDANFTYEASDLGNPDFTAWATATRAYLNAPATDVNVVIWSWCGQLSWATADDVDTYLGLMTGLETDFPGVTFVYMTGHRDIWSDTTLKQNNQRIRDYCLENHKVLYDFADIESYGPDGTYYEFAGDDCSYYDADTNWLGNWAQAWQESHAEGVYWYTCESAHSEPVNANRKAYAAWWLWARLAGWAGPDAEGEGEGTEGEHVHHAADQNEDQKISLTELLRVIQFFNLRGFYCAASASDTEDGYIPGPGTDHTCTVHHNDYNPADWAIDLGELLRVIQFFNMNGYHHCPSQGTEDGFCPGP